MELLWVSLLLALLTLGFVFVFCHLNGECLVGKGVAVCIQLLCHSRMSTRPLQGVGSCHTSVPKLMLGSSWNMSLFMSLGCVRERSGVLNIPKGLWELDCPLPGGYLGVCLLETGPKE